MWGIRDNHLTPRPSFFQTMEIRKARAGTPLRLIAHEDVLVLRHRPRKPAMSAPHRHTGRAAKEAYRVENERDEPLKTGKTSYRQSAHLAL
jgi:hypothetical protein